MLSHHNIISNIESMKQALATSPRDAIAAALPFFHSFGYTATLWFPMLQGFRSCYHPSPLDGNAMAKLVRENRATILLATPTFLNAYLRKAEESDFSTLRLVVTGAEKLAKNLANAFESKFKIRPRQGYGATELSPVAALNINDTTIGNIRYAGSVDNTIGRPLPGIAVRIVDPETGHDRRRGESGLLLVKAASVMTGYLNKPAETIEAIVDGWYVTGDIASINEQGFITLSDRLARFSKVGGEMISHGAIEDLLNDALATTEPAVAVTALPDERRGEKIVVVYTPQAGCAERLQAIIDGSELPNLWKPASDAYVAVDRLPVLGNGKRDLQELRRIALQSREPVELNTAA
jgi:acyl-[acyl-carrier-protein]-phospholipid O-acyltransferase/long-chain-fatty-acid--[acyl-carrier-protein] ligase